jgi:hypothetical protein
LAIGTCLYHEVAKGIIPKGAMADCTANNAADILQEGKACCVPKIHEFSLLVLDEP